jgi:hypothetical protein
MVLPKGKLGKGRGLSFAGRGVGKLSARLKGTVFCITPFVGAQMKSTISLDFPKYNEKILVDHSDSYRITNLYPDPCTFIISTVGSSLRYFLSLVMNTSILRPLK